MVTRKPQSAPLKNSFKGSPSEDEIIRLVYKVRDSYAAEHGHDLQRIYRDLKKRQTKGQPLGTHGNLVTRD